MSYTPSDEILVNWIEAEVFSPDPKVRKLYKKQLLELKLFDDLRSKIAQNGEGVLFMITKSALILAKYGKKIKIELTPDKKYFKILNMRINDETD